MNSASDPSPRYLGLTPAAAAILLLAVTTVFRFFYSLWLPLLPDEAYYFQWSRHLDASYFSKGPAVAYTIWTGTHLFGADRLGIRLFAVLLSAGTGWQLFLLARRCYDETTALIAVLVSGVVPLFALGGVIMTIDPLSAFFWVWAANSFSRALLHEKVTDWLVAGFAVGCGFLAKYLNALELVSFLALVLIVPSRRVLLRRAPFWLMLAVALACTLPVFWWNWHHQWVSASALSDRGHLHGPFKVEASTFIDFLGLQMLVVSPLLFLALLIAAIVALLRWKASRARSESELLLVLLFVPVFGLYAGLSWHLRCEANWPAISYLSLIIIMAAQWRRMLLVRSRAQPFLIMAFVLAWAQTLIMHVTGLLPLPKKFDPMARVSGWAEVATNMDDLRRRTGVSSVIADGYKEASILSYYMPGRPFIYTLKHDPPSSQYDLWTGYRNLRPRQVLCITSRSSAPPDLDWDYKDIVPLERIEIYYRGHFYRSYNVYEAQSK